MKKSTLFILLLSVCFFSSCHTDSSLLEIEKDSDNALREGDIMDKKDCFEIEYPIELIFPDDKVATIENEEDFYYTIKKWYKVNPKEKEKPSLKYPVNVNFEGDISKSINSEKDMISLKKYCDDKAECFAIVYPLSYEMPDGVVVTGESEDEVNTAMKSWYEANSSSKEKPSLIYPVDVVLTDGSTITIDNEAEMIEMKKEC